MKKFFLLILLACFALYARAQLVGWRNDHTGIYNETGLMKSWPAEGPELLWHFDGLGLGFSSVSIDRNRLFVTGFSDAKGSLFVLDMNGKLLNKVEYGTEFTGDNFTGTRSTAIPHEGKVYVVSGIAELFCYDIETLELLWKKNYAADYGGANTKHGWNGPPLIVGEMLIIAPGGSKHNVLALNKTTGEIIWSSEAMGGISGYGTPIFLKDQEVPQIVIMMGDHIVGLDVKDGKLLWSHDHTNRFSEHPNTPVYSNNMLCFMSAYGQGALMLRLVDGGRKVSLVWEMKELAHTTGHVIKAGDYIYGSGNRKSWYCVDWNTGKIMYADDTIAVGCIIAADGLLYCYSDKGEMALVRPNSEKFDIISKFSVTLGTEQHWAHPVIYKGILYVRHGDTLMAYKIN
jgi:FOG: WD40-like repeat